MSDLQQLNNVTLADDYGDAATILDPFGQAAYVACRLALTGGSAFYQLADRGKVFRDETFQVPLLGTISLPKCTGIRFRNGKAGVAAQLSAKLLEQGELTGAESFVAAPYSVGPDGAILPVLAGEKTAVWDEATHNFGSSTSPLVAIPAGRTFVIEALTITGSFSGAAGGGGSWVYRFRLAHGLDGASPVVTILTARLVWGISQIVNLTPAIIATPIPVSGGAGGNTLQGVSAFFGTGPDQTASAADATVLGTLL